MNFCEKIEAVSNKLTGNIYSNVIMDVDYYFDNLTAPSIGWFLTDQDIAIMKNEAIKHPGTKAGKVIDAVMKARGFNKLAGGTRRTAFIHPSCPNVVFKVAREAIALTDNLAEFKNQEILKPYCCKVFEVSPCGTVASFERVERIRSKEEFNYPENIISYFHTIYDYIINHLGYVIEDAGESAFMNWGIRKGDGLVLLDFPILYKVDGNKLFCKKPLINGGVCNGEIDYDAGFNTIRCKKCGKVYHRKDLEKNYNEDSKTNLITEKGEKKMTVQIIDSRTGRVIGEDIDNTKKSTFLDSTVKTPVAKGKVPEVKICYHTVAKKNVTTPEKRAVANRDSSKTIEPSITPLVRRANIITESNDKVKPTLSFLEVQARRFKTGKFIDSENSNNKKSVDTSTPVRIVGINPLKPEKFEVSEEEEEVKVVKTLPVEEPEEKVEEVVEETEEVKEQQEVNEQIVADLINGETTEEELYKEAMKNIPEAKYQDDEYKIYIATYKDNKTGDIGKKVCLVYGTKDPSETAKAIIEHEGVDDYELISVVFDHVAENVDIEDENHAAEVANVEKPVEAVKVEEAVTSTTPKRDSNGRFVSSKKAETKTEIKDEVTIEESNTEEVETVYSDTEEEVSNPVVSSKKESAKKSNKRVAPATGKKSEEVTLVKKSKGKRSIADELNA